MKKNPLETKNTGLTPYLSALGLWALAFGCSVGQGAFVMPGDTFLPNAGPLGTVIGIAIGALVMIVFAKNYHNLMNRFPDAGGTYTYTKKCFGYDHGFLNAWFLILTYIAILWANATALPIVARTVFGALFQFGFHYEIAGFTVYMGEILLAISALAVAALICLRRSFAAWTQIVMGILLLVGITVCFAAAFSNGGSEKMLDPAFVPGENSGKTAQGIFTIFALAPWAFAGFESVSHSAAESKFNLKKTFRILVIALITAGFAYIVLSLLAATAQPEGMKNWVEYLANLDKYKNTSVEFRPTFFAATSALGQAGKILLGLAAFFGIFTGLIGNYIALSRLVRALTEDNLIPGWIGKLDRNHVPRRVLFLILGISLIIPFFGRTSISWIVDATTVGATIAYAFASAAAWKTAHDERSKSGMLFGAAGLLFAGFFAFAFLIPNLISVKTLATESYLILATWGLLGFIVFHRLLRRDKNRRLGRSNVALIVMFGVIVFTSSVWMWQITDTSIEEAVTPIQGYYTERLEQSGIDVDSAATKPKDSYLRKQLDTIDTSLEIATAIQIGLIVATLTFLFVIYSHIQKREKEIEVEKALAEESSRAKTSFLSNMSHEIRTPMNAIIGLDNIALRDPDLKPKTREQLEKIGASAKHLLGLINDILDMSRIESGRMVLKDEDFSFREFIDQVNIIINGQCVDKGLQYECHIEGHLNDYYIGDDMKLKQILINILGNAVKFTEAPGEVTLTVKQAEKGEGVYTLQFVMQDTGIGMEEEYIPKIFEAFSQEDATTTNRYGGSGLGMAITKKFVEMMDGSIEVESQKGVGSTFTVTVVLRASDRSYQDESGLALPKNMHAMVVDDDEIACEHARLLLEALGVKADALTSPNEALAKMRDAIARKEPYDLLLTDYKMPETDGLSLVKSLREFDENKTAVIMLTGYNRDIIEEEAKQDGIDVIMAKPLFSDVLLHNILAVLERRNGALHADGSASADAALSDTLAGKRVLLAEDVDANAEILADILELEEILSERAENGQIAVEMFSSHPAGYYDAILMDVRMPVMDGLTATRTIRALEREDAKTVPIIAMTANVFDEDVERSLQAGMNAHLSKPIEPDKIFAKLTEWIGNGNF